jgi:hypothetical protein
MGKGVVQRRKTEKVANRKNAVWPGAESWAPEVVPLFKKKTLFRWGGVPRVGAVSPGLGACSPFLPPLMP